MESDIEIQCLLAEVMGATGVRDWRVDLGHAAIFRALVEAAEFDAEQEQLVLGLVQSKDLPALEQVLIGLSPELARALAALPTLYGGADILRSAHQRLPPLPAVIKALDELSRVTAEMGTRAQFDLADLRGYHYHSGMVFAAYVAGLPNAVALGGRYDEVGRAFGRARPATGFSMDLRELAALAPDGAPDSAILAPPDGDPSLTRRVAELRAAGEIVVMDLAGQSSDPAELQCDRRLEKQGVDWRIVPL